MTDDWMDVLTCGSFEAILPEITIDRGGSAICQGSGRISWQSNAPIRVQAATDGLGALDADVGTAIAPGTLIPHDTYVSATGSTQDGWSVTTTPVPFEGCHVHTGSPHVVWDFATHGVQLVRETLNTGPRTIHAVLGPPPERWTRVTETEVRSKYFGSRSYQADSLVAETSFGPVAARLRSNNCFHVRVELDSALPTADKVLTAIARAFGFALGHRVFVGGHEDLCPGRTTRWLALFGKPKENSLLKPLGRDMAYHAHIESLLGKAIDFFASDQGERVAQHLYLCWETVDSPFATRLAVASICVEGLVQIASQGASAGEVAPCVTDKTAFESWLDKNPEGLTPGFILRLRGFLGMMNQRRPVDVLRDWKKRGLLGVTQDDIEAWQNIRNSAAHAKLIEPSLDRSELQSRMSQFHRVQNLLNRIVLQLIGYRGAYVNYANSWWAATEFPATAPETL